ncbi:MAG: hypothetical protein ABIQ52_16675 [Vicinamibacterales bacterium]
MKRQVVYLAVVAAVLAGTPSVTTIEARRSQPDARTLVYADFERMENNRPVSTRGGLIQMFGYEESKVHKSTFKGIEGADPPVPELVHIKAGDPNRAMKFDYALHAPNPWAGVSVEIHGLPDVDGKPAPEDLSGYKTLSLQVYATGIEILRLEALSNTRGKDTAMTYPVMTFKVRPGLNTYRVPLKGFTQPAWASVRVDAKDIFKQLTSINLTAFCDQCEMNKQGMIIIDNVVFEK